MIYPLRMVSKPVSDYSLHDKLWEPNGYPLNVTDDPELNPDYVS